VRFVGISFDEAGYELDRLVTLVKPIPPTTISIEVPGATVALLEQAKAGGEEPSEVFKWLKEKSGAAETIIGHDISSEIQIMQILGARLTGRIWRPSSPIFCTMVAASPILNLAPRFVALAAGCREPRPPTIAECFRHFFNEDLSDADNPEIALEACIRIYRHLVPR
jgi:DNA polymerase-3 subunit epsilon